MLSKPFWDQIGIALSGICAVHCLFFPVAIALIPLWPVAESIHAWTHPILFVLIAPTVYFAIRSDAIPAHIPRFLLAGLLAIALAWPLHGWIGMWAESSLTLAGSVLLIAGHWLNYKQYNRRHRSACHI